MSFVNFEVEVGVVHGRVAPGRVVADVQRVVRPLLDRRPASNAALKTVVETWQTPPPSPFCSSPLMITGASWKPLSALRSPVVSLNENVAPGAISAPSISCATSWTLCSRPGVPPYVVV